MRAIRFINLYT